MSSLKITTEDLKLVDLYQKTGNENYILEFYNKFSKDICNVIYYRINSRFYGVPIEKDDLMHIVWRSVRTMFREFKNEDKGKFISFMMTKTYQATLREIRSFCTNGERIMNNVLSYEECVERNRNFENQKDNVVFIHQPLSETYREITQFIINKISKLDKKDVKKVVYLKSLGYSNIDIEKKLNFPRGYVRRIVETIKKIGEKY